MLNMKQNMKHNKKIECMIAFAMALIMIMTPINGAVPSLVHVFADSTYTITINYDDMVDVSSIIVADDGGNNLNSLFAKTEDTANKKVTYSGLTTGTEYWVYGNVSSLYQNKYTVQRVKVTETNNEITLSAITKNVVNFTVSVEHATVNDVTVDGNSLQAASGSSYTIPQYSDAADEVSITYTMDSGYAAAGEWGTEGIYKTTVSALVSNPAVTLTGAVLQTPQGNITITSANPAAGNGYYSSNASITATLELYESISNALTVQYGTSSSPDMEPVNWSDAAAVGSDGKKYNAELTIGGAASSLYCWFRLTDGTSSGNISTPLEIKIDGTEPQVTSVSIQSDAGPKEGVYWVKKDNQSNVAVKITASDSESGLDKIEYYWSNNNTIDFSQTGNYLTENITNDMVSIPLSEEIAGKQYLIYRIYDKCQNKTEQVYALSDIKYDFTEPALSVEFLNGQDVTLTEDEINEWQTGIVKVKVSAEDAEASGTGEEKSGYDYAVLTVKRDGEEVQKSVMDSSLDSITLPEDGIYELEIIAYDKAGNSSEKYTKTVKSDKSGITSKSVTLTPATPGNAYAGNFTVRAGADSISGIAHVEFTFHDNLTNKDIYCDVAAANNTAECPFPADAFPDGFEGTVNAVFYDNTGSIVSPHIVTVAGNDVFRYNKNGASIQMSADGNWTNGNAPVIVTVSDRVTEFQKIEFLVNDSVVSTITDFSDTHYYAGGIEVSDNSLSSEGTKVTVNVTSTAGVVTTEYVYVYVDKQAPNIGFSGVTEGAVYNTNRSLTVSTVENIWQKMQPVSITATRTIDGVTTNLDLGSYTADGMNSTGVRNFTEDGVYTITASAVDAAGNRDVKTITFTIDRTAPVLSISGTSDGAYSASPVTLNFQAIESFYETNNVTITVERKLEGATYGSTVNFVNSGKTSNVSNTFSADGDYTITMTAVDAAGNVAATQTLTFTVDATAPVVSITGTEDYFITSQRVALQFSVVESYFETNQVQISGSRKSADGKVTALNITGWTNTGRNSSLAQEFTEDGYYTITLTSTDKAGNTKQQMIHFTIDTQAPVIADLSKYNGKYLTSFKLDEDLDDLITELTAPSVKMSLNGKAYDGSEITEDGKYTLVIEVMDEVGLTESKTIEFVIDNTVPKIIFAGVEDGKTYTEAIQMNLALENENDTIVRILINGEEQDLTDGKSSYDFEFNAFGEYEVTVETMDEAGNTNSQSITFTYAEHRNAGYLWILIIALLVVIALIVVIVMYSKKKKNN